MIYRTQNKNRIEIVLFFYWVVLVSWQNISNATTRTGLDTVIKAGLIITLCLVFLGKSNKKFNFSMGIIFFFAMSLLITFILFEKITLNSILAYFYPILLLICIYGLGRDFTINKKQLLFILNGVILVVLYMVFYALIFKTSQFERALSLNSAYGNELSSFLKSNHEYGLYLSMAIISSIICYDLKQDKPFKQKWYYIAVIPLFLINLILTFSRTSLLGVLVAMIVYCILGKKSSIKNVIIIGLLIATILVLSVDKINYFFFKIVLKDGTLAGRDYLTELAIEKFKNGDLVQKLFGYGNSNFREITAQNANHSSIHNAYLQVLLSYGLIPLLFLVAFLIYDVVYCIKLSRKNKFIGVLFLSVVLFGVAIMATNTTILFSSPIDSYFLTIFVVVLPKYVGNAVIKKEFD